MTINSGGEKIFAEEVELAVKAHPGVYDCVVAGRPSERWGSEVVAIVRRRDGADVDAGRACSTRPPAHIARYKLPKAIVFVDEIVRSPSGKADYRWARERRRLVVTHGPRAPTTSGAGGGHDRRSLGRRCSTTTELRRHREPVVATSRSRRAVKIELATPSCRARPPAAGRRGGAAIPRAVVRDDPSVNAPWSWHIDPATLEFADMTIEVVRRPSNRPSTEAGTVTSTVCWSATSWRRREPLA